MTQDGQTALDDALIEHDRLRRANLDGVTSLDLRRDAQRWIELGQALGRTAQQVSAACRAATYTDRRPSPALLAQRMAEAIDDHLDLAAWGVVTAAAQAQAKTEGDRHGPSMI